MRHFLIRAFILLYVGIFANEQTASAKNYWHGKERTLRYRPDGEEFVIQNGTKRFSRSIYGTNTGFRFETSDFPEFGLYMPNFGGSVYMAIKTKAGVLWIRNMESVEARFKSGQRTYIVKDKKVLGKGSLTIDAVALSDGEGLVVRYIATNVPKGTKMLWVYGGAGNQSFTRGGDLGADPESSFYIQGDNCVGNIFDIKDNTFSLSYGKKSKVLTYEEKYEDPKTLKKPASPSAATAVNTLKIDGTFPTGTSVREANGGFIDQLNQLIQSSKSDKPVIVAEYALGNTPFYFELHNPKSHADFKYDNLAEAFNKGVEFRTRIASRMKINTPDPYLNTLGGVFSGAEDAVWQSPSYLHGAICFRDLLLTGWRGAYLADLLGLQDRATTHFNAYAKSQVTGVPVTLPALFDSALHLARPAKIWGTPMYSTGYICRIPNRNDVMHHYDMNLVYIDQLLWHLNWTGDLEYAKKVFPTIERSLAWEKNTFDPDNDGLYDACAVIWASDALQYNGSKVTHSSAYNYRANKLAAEIAKKIGKDPSKYEKEANLILSAINKQLWIKDKGWWAEFKDNMGNQMTHEDAGVWTIYHSIDSDIHDMFKAWQATRYIDTEIPHIPVLAKDLNDDSNYVVATTNWQPYMWSINNVAFGEVMHTALSYWQTGRADEAFKLFKGNILDAMYMGSTPGNVSQLSFYDAARGEMYRDFADADAMGVRALVQGMFGIIPDLMNDTLTIKPGFPESWNYADLETQNMGYHFKRSNNKDTYTIIPNLLRKNANLVMVLSAPYNQVKAITVNGKKATYKIVADAIQMPHIRVEAGVADKYEIAIEWTGSKINKDLISVSAANGSQLNLSLPVKADEIYDPQEILKQAVLKNNILTGTVSATAGNRTLFVKTSSGDMSYWAPVDIKVAEALEIINNAEATALKFELKNNTPKAVNGDLYVNDKMLVSDVTIAANSKNSFSYDAPVVSLGSNKVELKTDNETYSFTAINWNIAAPAKEKYETVNMEKLFNNKITKIYEYGKYLSPRWKYTTFNVPTQGMGQWCHPNDISIINDSCFRKVAAANNNTFTMPQGVPFSTPGASSKTNIAFTSLWDNYPKEMALPLNGKASKAYFLLAGSTYYMQTHILNGVISVKYKDGTHETLELILPDNLIPLDQDIFIDKCAFDSPQPRPWRVRLKTGDVSKYHSGDMGKTITNNPMYVDGGMATMLDLPLNPNKELESVSLKTVANEVIIGLMSVTLVR